VTESNPTWVEAMQEAERHHDDRFGETTCLCGFDGDFEDHLAELRLTAVVPLIEAATRAKCAEELKALHTLGIDEDMDEDGSEYRIGYCVQCSKGRDYYVTDPCPSVALADSWVTK
jgi:hypothetical protein